MKISLGEKVRMKREEMGISQEELAARMGYKSRSSINKIETGRPISQKIIARLSKALNVPIAYLMDWDQEQIEAVSKIQDNANAYEDEAEKGLKSLYEEFGEMHLTNSEINQLRSYAKIMRNQNIAYGEVIKEARIKKGYTIDQLAEKIGATVDEVKAYEDSRLFPANRLKEIYFTLDITYFMMLGIRQHFDETYQKIYALELTSDELKEVFEYAKYLKSKRKDD